MKKIAAVLVLALVAMTAVFAATTATAATTNDNDLKVSLTVDGYTRFGFTDATVVGTELTEITSAGDKPVAGKTSESNTVRFFASVISTNKGGADVTLTLPTALTCAEVTDTIAINYVKKPAANYTVNGTGSIVRDSQEIELYVENYDNKASGDYAATFVMTVIAL